MSNPERYSNGAAYLVNWILASLDTYNYTTVYDKPTHELFAARLRNTMTFFGLSNMVTFSSPYLYPGRDEGELHTTLQQRKPHLGNVAILPDHILLPKQCTLNATPQKVAHSETGYVCREQGIHAGCFIREGTFCKSHFLLQMQWELCHAKLGSFSSIL